MDIREILLDAVLDTLKLLPWLVIIYIIIELIEHKTRLSASHNRLNGKLGPLIGAATGLIPQCGFSVMAAKLFEQKYITVGTLLAIFLATSDEAFIILLSSGQGAVWLLPLIVVKILIGVIAGYAADAILCALRGRAEGRHAPHAAEGKEGTRVCDDHEGHEEHDPLHECDCEGAHALFLKREEEKEFECTSCGRVHDEKRPAMTYFVAPLLHALKVAAFILAVNVVLGLIIGLVTEERFMEFMERGRFVQPLITSLIGLIPNCASSVVITECFLQGGITFGSCVAGLCANAGLGFVVLLKNTRKWKRNLALVAVCWCISVLVGIAINAIVV